MNPLVDTLCTSTYTVADLHRRFGLLEECLESVLYQSNANSGLSLAERCMEHIRSVATEEDVSVISKWGNTVWESYQSTNVAQGMITLKQEIQLLPVIVMYVPVEFNTEALEIIGSWGRKNINPHILFDMQVDASVSGGCAFVHNSTYHDYSLRHFMEEQKGVVTQLLASYE